MIDQQTDGLMDQGPMDRRSDGQSGLYKSRLHATKNEKQVIRVTHFRLAQTTHSSRIRWTNLPTYQPTNRHGEAVACPRLEI